MVVSVTTIFHKDAPLQRSRYCLSGELETLGNSNFAANADMRLLRQGHTPEFRYHDLVTDDDGMQHVTLSLTFPYRTVRLILPILSTAT